VCKAFAYFFFGFGVIIELSERLIYLLQDI
jgi:hypothetical protein